MNANYYNGGPVDDDPYGEAHESCPGCPARDGEPCEPGCTCGACERDEDADGEAFRGGEAAAYEREQQADIQRDLK